MTGPAHCHLPACCWQQVLVRQILPALKCDSPLTPAPRHVVFTAKQFRSQVCTHSKAVFLLGQSEFKLLAARSAKPAELFSAFSYFSGFTLQRALSKVIVHLPRFKKTLLTTASGLVLGMETLRSLPSCLCLRYVLLTAPGRPSWSNKKDRNNYRYHVQKYGKHIIPELHWEYWQLLSKRVLHPSGSPGVPHPLKTTSS